MSDQTWAQRLQKNREVNGVPEETIRPEVLSDDEIFALSVETLAGLLFTVMDNGESYGYTPKDGELAEKYWTALSKKTPQYKTKEDFYKKRKK